MRKLREEREMQYDCLKIYNAEIAIECQIIDFVREHVLSHIAIECQIIDLVREHVLSHFGVEEIKELTEENITEVQGFLDTIGVYNFMGIGSADIMAEWEES
jgi:hypothetical protein